MELIRSTKTFKIKEDVNKHQEYIKIKTIIDEYGKVISKHISLYYVKNKK